VGTKVSITYYSNQSDKEIEPWCAQMLHVCTEENVDLGWVYPENLTKIEQ